MVLTTFMIYVISCDLFRIVLFTIMTKNIFYFILRLFLIIALMTLKDLWSDFNMLQQHLKSLKDGKRAESTRKKTWEVCVILKFNF